MTPELKAKWVEALRSGKYEQACSGLRAAENRFCCLGVLCDVDGSGHWYLDFTSEYRYVSNGLSHGGYLPSEIREGAGIKKDTEIELAQMNDSGYTFDEIANWIEQNL